MKKIIYRLLLIFSVIFVVNMNVKASSIKKAQDRKSTLQQNIKDVGGEIQRYKKLQKKLKKDIKHLDKRADKIQGKIDKLNGKLTSIAEDISSISEQLEENEKSEEQMYNSLKKKIRFVYENSGGSQMQDFANVDSMADILNKPIYVNEMYGFDKDKINELKELIEVNKEFQNKLKDRKADLEDTKKDYQDKQDEVSALLREKQDKINNFDSKIKNSELRKKAFLSDIQEQDRIIARIERQARIAREKERKRLEALKKKNKNTNNTNQSSSKRSYSGGKFRWPCPNYKRISSVFGYRMHPTMKIKKMHNGVDMAASTGSAILAAADGTVIGAGYNASMGNYVMIDHGNGLTTIYMHCSKLKVSRGQSVKAGGNIASVGSTGRATGPHLHFGVMKNRKYVNPMTYLK